MFELLVGFFLLGSLSLAFRETAEAEERHEPIHPPLPESFDASVYEPRPMIEEEVVFAREHATADIPEPFVFTSLERFRSVATQDDPH